MKYIFFLSMLVFSIFSFLSFHTAQAEKAEDPALEKDLKDESQKGARKIILEGSMTLTKMDEIIRRLDKNTKSARKGIWSFVIAKRPVVIVTDVSNNRMRIMVPIREVAGLTPDELKRLMQANFDTALDSRYAIAKNVLWATYIHSLSTLHERQFISAIGQTVNVAITYGTSYSSGLLTFHGGDSKGILRRKLIDKLLEEGLPI